MKILSHYWEINKLQINKKVVIFSALGFVKEL